LFTRAEYHRLAEANLFFQERVELLNGVIVAMSPQNSPHAGTIHRLLRILVRLLGTDVAIRVQAPIILDDWSEPEPDLVLCQPDPDDYTREHPHASQVLLIIEVADTSLTYDRSEKATAYAASGIPEYWIVNLPERQVEVWTAPDRVAQRYRQILLASTGETLALPGQQTLSVAAVLPPC
jgi:Uma2 family endonuclease